MSKKKALDSINIVNASAHNLRNVSIEIPVGSFVCFLVFPALANPPWHSTPFTRKGNDVIWIHYHHKKKKRIETLPKPPFDHIEGLSPTISVAQNNNQVTTLHRRHDELHLRLPSFALV